MVTPMPPSVAKPDNIHETPEKVMQGKGSAKGMTPMPLWNKAEHDMWEMSCKVASVALFRKPGEPKILTLTQRSGKDINDPIKALKEYHEAKKQDLKDLAKLRKEKRKSRQPQGGRVRDQGQGPSD